MLDVDDNVSDEESGEDSELSIVSLSCLFGESFIRDVHEVHINDEKSLSDEIDVEEGNTLQVDGENFNNIRKPSLSLQDIIKGKIFKMRNNFDKILSENS